MKVYQATALFSVLFALMGFSYNVWRMEVTEHNNNVRSAAFEMFLQLAELEQLVFAAHYDSDPVAGNPRVGWVKVGLIGDLGRSCSMEVADAAIALKGVWSDHWETLPQERASANAIVAAIDHTRAEVQVVLTNLE
ncbi:MAG: hypothetical protein ABJN62_12065 [Halioglobus sp.]